MDLLDRLLGHDAWTTGELLVRCSDLTDDQRRLGLENLPEGDVLSWEQLASRGT